MISIQPRSANARSTLALTPCAARKLASSTGPEASRSAARTVACFDACRDISTSASSIAWEESSGTSSRRRGVISTQPRSASARTGPSVHPTAWQTAASVGSGSSLAASQLSTSACFDPWPSVGRARATFPASASSRTRRPILGQSGGRTTAWRRLTRPRWRSGSITARAASLGAVRFRRRSGIGPSCKRVSRSACSGVRSEGKGGARRASSSGSAALRRPGGSISRVQSSSGAR